MASSPPPPPNGYSACHAVIGDTINRCRYGETVSRVTIVIQHLENNPAPMLSSFQVSISDTGCGISREDVPKLYQCFLSAHPTHLCSAPLFWGGKLLIMTTEFMEEEVRHYQMDDAFYKPRIMQMRSLSKESGRYCGTNITLHFKGYPEKLLLHIHDVCRKVEILMLKNVAIEVCNARLPLEGSISEDVLLFSDGLSLPPELSNLERLSIGLSNHTLNSLDENSLSSVSKRMSLKIGKGRAGSSETATEMLWFFEVCFAVTEASNIDDTGSTPRQVETKVLFFQDFICASITPTIVQSLRTKVNWENFGLKIKNIRLDDFGTAIIEWENLSRFDNIGLALHRYKSSQTRTVPWSREATLLKRSVEESLNDLKHQYPHLILSHHSLEVQKYTPDLSNCIARLISSSSDASFKASCAEILGVESADFLVVEQQIKAKVLQIIENSDKMSAQDAFQKNQKKGSSKDFLICEEHDESQFVEEDEDEGGDYDSYEGTSIWEYL